MSAIAITVAISGAAPAHAGVSKDFRECDGLKKPKRSNDGMRGEATIPSWGGFGGNNESPARVVSACNAALESGKIRSEQTMRLAHVLRARAAAHIRLGNIPEAITDLDAAEEATAGYVGSFFYDRSMGVSLKLLRAIALYESGESEQARALAADAAEMRPYALQIQHVAAAINRTKMSDADDSGREDTGLQTLLQIDPKLRASGVLRPKSSVAAYVEAAGEPELILPPIKAPRVPGWECLFSWRNWPQHAAPQLDRSG